METNEEKKKKEQFDYMVAHFDSTSRFEFETIEEYHARQQAYKNWLKMRRRENYIKINK